MNSFEAFITSSPLFFGGVLAAALSFGLYTVGIFKWDVVKNADIGYKMTVSVLTLDAFLLLRIALEDSIPSSVFASFTALVLTLFAVLFTRLVLFIMRGVALWLLWYVFSKVPNVYGQYGGLIAMLSIVIAAYLFYREHLNAVTTQLVLSVVTSINMVVFGRFFFVSGESASDLWHHSVDHLMSGMQCVHDWDCWLDGVIIASLVVVRLCILVGLFIGNKDKKTNAEDQQLSEAKKHEALTRLEKAMATGKTNEVINIVQTDLAAMSHEERMGLMRTRRDAAKEMEKKKKGKKQPKTAPVLPQPVYVIEDDEEAEEEEEEAEQVTEFTAFTTTTEDDQKEDTPPPTSTPSSSSSSEPVVP
jgi:hypothetical protein